MAWWALGLFAAFVLWNGLDDRLVDCARPVLGVLQPRAGISGARRARAVCGGARATETRVTIAGLIAGLLLGVLGWALLGKVFPGLFPDGARVARLPEPDRLLECASAHRRSGVAAWPVAGSGRRHERLVRAGGVVLLYVATIALVLTYSRAGIVVAAAGVLLWLWLCRDRFEGLLMLLAGVGPGLVVFAWASTEPGIVDHLQTRQRARAGAWFARPRRRRGRRTRALALRRTFRRALVRRGAPPLGDEARSRTARAGRHSRHRSHDRSRRS